VTGAELGEGVDDIVRAVAAEALVFTFIEYFDFGGAVGIGEYLWCSLPGLERLSRSAFHPPW